MSGPRAVFVGTIADAVQVIQSGVEPSPAVTWGGWDPITLAVLDEALTDVPLEVGESEQETVADGGDEGPWCVQPPSRLLAALTGMSDADVARCAHVLVDCDEDQMLEFEDTQAAVRELRDLVHGVATSGSRDLFCWMSL